MLVGHCIGQLIIIVSALMDQHVVPLGLTNESLAGTGVSTVAEFEGGLVGETLFYSQCIGLWTVVHWNGSELPNVCLLESVLQEEGVGVTTGLVGRTEGLYVIVAVVDALGHPIETRRVFGRGHEVTGDQLLGEHTVTRQWLYILLDHLDPGMGVVGVDQEESVSRRLITPPCLQIGLPLLDEWPRS